MSYVQLKRLYVNDDIINSHAYHTTDDQPTYLLTIYHIIIRQCRYFPILWCNNNHTPLTHCCIFNMQAVGECYYTVASLHSDTYM